MPAHINTSVTSAIVLTRFNFGEADRIITVITPEQGKLKLLVRGARKIKSKLAGSVELFSVSSLTYTLSRKEINTLISGKLQSYFENILTDYDRTMVGYDILKIVNSATQDNTDSEYYHLLLQTLTYLNNPKIGTLLIKGWFIVNILKIMGHELNTSRDTENVELVKNQEYKFDYKEMLFARQQYGDFGSNHIKFLKLLKNNDPLKLHLITGIDKILVDLNTLLLNILKIHLS